MKNIHVIPTDKPSGLFYIDKNLFYLPEEKDRSNWKKELVKTQHIYITSDEEIISFNEINSLPLTDGKDIQTNMSNI